MTETIKQASTPAAALDPTEAVEDLLRSLKTRTEGLSSREAQRRLAQYGPNQLQRRGACSGRESWPGSSRTRWRCCCGWRRCCRSSSAASRSVSRWC